MTELTTRARLIANGTIKPRSHEESRQLAIESRRKEVHYMASVDALRDKLREEYDSGLDRTGPQYEDEGGN